MALVSKHATPKPHVQQPPRSLPVGTFAPGIRFDTERMARLFWTVGYTRPPLPDNRIKRHLFLQSFLSIQLQ